jgi:hypothetical protein
MNETARAAAAAAARAVVAIEPEGEALTRMIRAGDREGDRGGASSRECSDGGGRRWLMD